MPTSNPALSDKAFERAGWAAPPPGTIPPAPDTVSAWQPATPTAAMTVNGSITATGALLVLLVAAGFVGWLSTDTSPTGVEIPAWTYGTGIAAFVIGLVTVFKPMWARVTGPLYALGMGAFVGAISKAYEVTYDGIVFQAVAGTVGVLAVMLFLFATRLVQVTDKFRMIVACATGAICLVYVFNLVLRLFGSEMPFLHDTGALGIGISLVIVVVASLNLLLDFDFIERGAAARAPKAMEWYAGFGLLVTLVWLYLELLRLISKLQRR